MYFAKITLINIDEDFKMYKKYILLTGLFLSLLFTTGCNMSKVDVNTLNEKAAVYMQNGEYDKAIERLNSINDLDPTFPATYYNLGIAYYNKEDYQKARENLQKAISMNKNLKEAYYSLAIVYEDEAAKISSDEDALQASKAQILQCYHDAILNYEKYLNLNTDAKENEKIKERIEFLTKQGEALLSGRSEEAQD